MAPAGEEEAVMLKPLRTLDAANGRFDKHWPLKDQLHDQLLHDYLQKIAYSIHDFNGVAAKETSLNREDVVYVIVLTDWINEAAHKLRDCFDYAVVEGFQYSRGEELNKLIQYFKTVRSFVVAHPLSTSKHPKYGFNGAYSCIDIALAATISPFYIDGLRRLSPDGLIDASGLRKNDVVLNVYSTENGAEFFRHICFSLEDVRAVSELNIKMLYELNGYLRRLRKKDFGGS